MSVVMLGVLLCVCLVCVGCLPESDGAAQTAESPAAPAPTTIGTSKDPVADAVAVLRTWDGERARAFAQGDASALAALYTAGSAAGTADVAVLRAYARRGLRVHGLRMQLLEVKVLDRSVTELRLRVTDRVSGAVAMSDGRPLPLPRDQASVRTLVLKRTPPDSSWQVAAVSR